MCWLFLPTWLFLLAGLNVASKHMVTSISVFLFSRLIFSGANEALAETFAMLCDLKHKKKWLSGVLRTLDKSEALFWDGPACNILVIGSYCKQHASLVGSFLWTS